MIQLQQKEIEKLATITNLSPLQVSKLIALGILNDNRCLDAILVYDWKRLKRRKQYKVSQIFEALMERYKVSKSRVERAVYYKQRKKKYCEKCQREISNREYNRGNGKCDRCVGIEIDF